MANANQLQPPVTYDQISGLFGIKDMNDKIIVPPDANVFSTNVFIPMEGNVTSKSYFYLSGMVKLVETFQARINNSGLKDNGWMLFIYYDSMFNDDSEYNNSVYNTKNNNNNTNKEIKTNYGNNKDQLKQLLQLYKNYLKIIKLNIGGKYSFVKLYSFNCDILERKKEKGYLGHPSTFGSMVRFIPMFDPQIKRIFCINISHAISPRLCYLISKWVDSDKILLTNNYSGYLYNGSIQIGLFKKLKIPAKLFKELNNLIPDELIEDIEESIGNEVFYPRIAAGLFGFYKNENQPEFMEKFMNDRNNDFFNFMKKLIDNYNIDTNFDIKVNDPFINLRQKQGFKIEKINIFYYGIDEIILGYLFRKLSYKNYKLLMKTNKKEYLRVVNENILYFNDGAGIFNIDKDQNKILSWIVKNNASHRYISRLFIQDIGLTEEIIEKFTKNILNCGFDQLLNSFDEIKPLIILSNTKDDSEYDIVKDYPQYFTFMNSNQPKLLCKLLEYYRDTTKVLPVPYVMSEESQAGGSIKSKLKKKTIKKSKQTKKKIRLIKSVKIKN
jgi:hypothetical protein